MRETLDNLHSMAPIEINQIACDKLNQLLERCTVNLVANLTGITRTTLYRWLDPDRSLEEMDYKVSGWFIILCETSPKLQLLLNRAPLSHPRLASRLLQETEQ